MTDDRWLELWDKRAQTQKKQYASFLQKAKVRNTIQAQQQFTKKAYETIDCLACARCCKHYSPRFKVPDIKRISKHLKLKESVFIDKYLMLDEDGDYILQKQPCHFLNTADNKCSIYEVRPSDCQRYPYTDEDVLIKRKQITLKNASFCPITMYVLDELIGNKS